jgi:cold shock CspA family protein
MGRSNETFSKKEKEKKRKEKQKEKAERREERKASAQKGKPLEEQFAYVDENGNLSSTPPDPTKKRHIDVDNILLGAKPIIDEPKVIRLGMVTMFNNEKGYGFIRDLKTQESIFVHINNLKQPIKERDKVAFETEDGPKGPIAVNVKLTG